MKIIDFNNIVYCQAESNYCYIFTIEKSAVKSIYLAIEQIQYKWTMPIRNWNLVFNQLMIKFDL